MIPEWILRWIALSLLGFVTFVFILLGAAVLSGLTNELFLNFLDLTWPPQEAEQQLSLERLKLTTGLVMQILGIVATKAVVDFAADGNLTRVRLVSVLDRDTEWRTGTDRY